MPIKDLEERKAYGKKYYQDNKQKIQEYQIRYKDENKELMKEKRKENAETLHKQYKEWARNNKERRLENHRKHKRSIQGRYKDAQKVASKRDKTFTLTLEQYYEVVSKPCYYCDNKFGQAVVAGSGLDRIDSSLGYEPGNVVSCCKNCNTVKSNLLSIDEMKAAIELILRMRGLI